MALAALALQCSRREKAPANAKHQDLYMPRSKTTKEGGVKALVYELGTGNANGERIEETSPALDVCPNIQRGDGAAAAIHACA